MRIIMDRVVVCSEGFCEILWEELTKIYEN